MIAITNSAHPWAAHLDRRMDTCLDRDDLPKDWQDRCAKARVVFDLTFTGPEEKGALLDSLGDFAVISDTSCLWGEFFFKTRAHLAGALCCAFFSPTNTCEYCLRDEKFKGELDQFWRLMDCQGIAVSSPGIGFTWPRIMATVINEAWYAREEGLAETSAIDTALKYGLRHPLGPFEWTDKIGAFRVVALLDELLRVTGDPRYRACPLLRLEAA